tara:strand:+ start:19 stop:1365 length:1347 start_codon:yes stop_codon:yes gene_type:complete
MWQLLYDSLNEMQIIDLLDTDQDSAIDIINATDGGNDDLRTAFINLVASHRTYGDSDIQRIYAIEEKGEILGFLYGNHVLNLTMQPLYTELIQRAVAIKSSDAIVNATVNTIVNRIIKQKNSIISSKEFEILKRFSTSNDDGQFMENIYCINCDGFLPLRLNQLCTTRHFKQIKNEYSRKWKTSIAMKDLRVTKLYYKKHLLVGFTLYRQEDGEQFFWSGQFQEVLESLIPNKQNILYEIESKIEEVWQEIQIAMNINKKEVPSIVSLIFVFAWKFQKIFNKGKLDIDFKKDISDSFSGGSFLDLFIKINIDRNPPYVIGFKFKFPIEGEIPSCHTEVRQKMINDLKRLDFLTQNSAMDLGVFLCATNQEEYLNYQDRTNIKEFQVHHGKKYQKGDLYPLNDVYKEQVTVTNDIRFEWSKNDLINNEEFSFLKPIYFQNEKQQESLSI